MMIAFDVDGLLKPISAESPCGADLAYDQEFGELERASHPVAEQQFGKTVVEGRPPDWKEIRRKGLSLLGRTKDLRVAVLLAEAALRTDGMPGFHDALAIVRGLVERYWKDVHPHLDPEDGNDPSLRVNTLCALIDNDACLQALGDVPLVASPALGKFSYRDYQVASGELPPGVNGKAVTMPAIEAAFRDADVQELQAGTKLLREAMDDVVALEIALTKEVGVGKSASFAPLGEMLKKMLRLMTEQLQRLGVAEVPEKPAEKPPAKTDGQPVAGPPAPAVAAKPPALDEVRSREDVIRLLDKICEYYQKHEPSSPLPLMLKRAKRAAGMTFLELIRELTPGGVREAEAVSGAAADAAKGGGDAAKGTGK